MSAYLQAISHLEKAHLLIDGDGWREIEIRTILGRMIDLMEETLHAAPEPRGSLVCLAEYKARAVPMARSRS